MDGVISYLQVGDVTGAGCECCHTKPAAVKLLCRACYFAALRRAKRGEAWVDAVESVRRMVERRGKGWVR